MSPPAVEIGSSVEKISSFLNPTENFSAFFPESVHSQDQPSMDSSFSFGFGADSGQKTKSRPKLRLIKLRKNARKVKSPSFPGEILSGFNPFAPPSKGSLHMNSGNDRNDSNLPGDKCFVFGANGSSFGAKGNATVTPLSDEDEFSTPIGHFGLGSESSKEHSDGVVGKEDIDHRDNIRPCSGSTNCDAKSGLRFGGGENVRNPDIDKKSESKSCFDTCGKSNSGQYADGRTVVHRDGPELNLPAEMKKLNISDTNVHGGSGYEEASRSNNTPTFVFASFGKVDTEYNSAATSGPWSFSSSGFNHSDNAADEQPTFHSKTTNVNNLTNTSFGTRTSIDGFKVPQWDPSVLKQSLFPEVSKNPVHARRNSSSKDKRSKKVKEKSKQHEPNRCNDQASEGMESQDKIYSPGYCSPMDFSPYEGEKTGNQFPIETPLTSSTDP